MFKREFTVEHEYQYDRSSPARWILSHFLRYKSVLLGNMILTVLMNVCFAVLPFLIGAAFNAVQLGPRGGQQLIVIAFLLLGLIAFQGSSDLWARLLSVVMSKRFMRDAREELYISLLGKSQAFHNRQRVGDVMARASNDVTQLGDMTSPAFDTIFDSFSSLAINILFIALLNPQLLLVPFLYLAAFLISLFFYARKLMPVSQQMRKEFGVMNSVLNETIAGVEVVRATSQEEREIQKFTEQATLYRDMYVKNGKIQGHYLPTLFLGLALALSFLHGLSLYANHQLSVGDLVAFMGLMTNLRFVTYMSIWTFGLVQLGIASVHRILTMMREETTLDENEAGYQRNMRGELVFEHVSFGYGDTPVLRDVSFRAQPGQTIAIVGQTGSGKSSLTKLVNRIYDVDEGRVLIDGIDVRDWNLHSLRSQISTIEQDIFLFSRTIAENIAFGLGKKVEREALERASRDAQAHQFIQHFPSGYETEIGERGVDLSGGQRQRLAIARALLTNPSILILDDATSAIDSATEDEIQQAISRLLQGRTTLLITHRLSQIRRADHVLVLRQGRLVDQGTHDDLLGRCDLYRRIFSHYDSISSLPVISGE